MASIYTPPPRHIVSYDGAPAVPMRELLRRIARRYRLILGITVVVFAGVAIFAFAVTPRYRSEARLRIETQSSVSGSISALADQATSSSGLPGGAASAGGGGGGGSGLGSLLGLGRDELETEIAVLKSDRVADATVDSLALGVRLRSPDVNRATLLTARTSDPSVDADGRIILTRQAGGKYDVELKKFDEVPNVPKVITPGVPFQVGGFVITLQPRLFTGGPGTIKLDILPRYKVHKLLDKRLMIERQEGGSRLVDVTFDDPDRVLAAQVVNTLVGEYVKYSTNTERGQDTTTVVQLRFQVDSAARKLASAEAALRAFEERSRLIVPQDQASAQIKRISTISGKVDALSTERNALARMLDIIRQRSNGGTNGDAYRQLATFPSLITNRAIQDLLQSLLDLENRRAELGVRRTEANPEYKQLTDRIAELQRQLFTVGSQYLESLDQQLAMTVHTVSSLSDTLNMIPGAAMQYGRLLRDRTVNEAIYIGLEKQLKLAELRDVLRQDKVKIVDVPRIANIDDPQFPKKPIVLSVGAVLGLVLALTIVLFMELWREPEMTISGDGTMTR